MVPHALLQALVARVPELEGVEVVHLHIDGDAPHVHPSLEGHLRHNALFVGPNTRQAVAEGRSDFTPAALGTTEEAIGAHVSALVPNGAGAAVIALPSTAQRGQASRIVPRLLAGAGVVTTRGHVPWVVTERGAVNLHGRSLRGFLVAPSCR